MTTRRSIGVGGRAGFGGGGLMGSFEVVQGVGLVSWFEKG